MMGGRPAFAGAFGAGAAPVGGFQGTAAGGAGQFRQREALNRELAAATLDPEVKAQLLAIGLEPEASTPAALGAMLAEDIERWRPVVERSGFKVD
jgi:tripartite-type tricarboxylate transporter receptor subunit TctC